MAPVSQIVQKSSGLLVTTAILILPESRLQDGSRASVLAAASRNRARRERVIGKLER